MNYINVVIDNNTRYTDTLYTYRAPGDIDIGDVVKVPFNRGNSIKRAFVVERVKKVDLEESKIKDIDSLDSNISLNKEMIETSKWMKLRYGVKYLDGIRCFVPAGKMPKKGKEKRPLEETVPEENLIEELTGEQQKACAEINKAIEGGRQKNFLIHGVTGSGKTEVYIQAIAKALSIGKTAIMLVPEIALTKQITERFVSRFGKDQVAILHSKLTERERFDEWSRIRRSEARVVIGARMAVFAPVENIGVIVMDEEHEQTYKADKNPKYDTVDVALKRVMYYKGVLILGSATPSIVSYQRAKDGIYKLITLKERYNQVSMPFIELADMREELKAGNRSIFSNRLKNKIKETVDSGEQVILFLNRRGYSNFILCRDCGNVFSCEECGIPMTYHKSEGAVVCHYCGRRMPVPHQCNVCGSDFVRFYGVGTEQLEEFAQLQFLDYKVDRLDLDTAKSRKSIDNIIEKFASGKTDILVGTQLVAKGLDFKNVGLVGVLSADLSLNIPDYRAGERTLQLITQVAGRAGRGDKRGHVIVQTFTPDNTAIKMASEYDYEGYFDYEIKFRDMMGYPPFTDLILVEFTDKKEDKAQAAADRFYNYIKGAGAVDETDDIFSPKVSRHFAGSREAFRYYVLIKSRKETFDKVEKGKNKRTAPTKRNMYISRINGYIDSMIKAKSTTSVVIDVNPYSTI